MTSNTELVAATIAAYTAKLDSWPDIEGWVRSVVTDSRPPSRDSAKHLLFAYSRLADWALRVGEPLDRERLIHPDAIERFILAVEADYSVGVVRTIRSRIRATGPKVTRRAPWPQRPPAIRRSMQSAPYSPVEIARLRHDLANQPVEANARFGTVVLDLGLAAGLKASELVRATADWISERHGVVGIQIPEDAGRARFVPFIADHVPAVLAHAERWPTGLLAHPEGLRFDRMTRRLRLGDRTPGLHSGRLRSTWIVWHLDHHTPTIALLRAAGLSSYLNLTDFLPHLAERDTAADYRLLATGGEHFGEPE